MLLVDFDIFSIKSIYWGDDHYKHWYADLVASDFLINKLQKELLLSDKSKILCQEPKPEFYATYTVAKKTVDVFARFHFNLKGISFSGATYLPFSSLESDLLIQSIEELCRQLYDGKDCLTVLNDVRMMYGKALLGFSLDEKIRTANTEKFSSVARDVPPNGGTRGWHAQR